MYQTNLLDETFDINQAHNYNLFIQYGINGLSFCLFDTIRNKCIAFRHYLLKDIGQPEDINNIIVADDLLKLSYKTIGLLYMNSKSTIVPGPFFDDKEASRFFQFAYGEENVPVLYNNLPDISAVNVFSYHSMCLEVFKQRFPGIKVFHRTTPFITDLVQNSAKGHKICFFVAIYEGVLDIGLAHAKKLDFFNSFAYHDKQDMIYYILNVLDQFKLPVMHTDVFVSADLDNHQEIFTYLHNYLRHVKFIKPTERYTYTYIFDEAHLTRFSNLFNLSLCV